MFSCVAGFVEFLFQRVSAGGDLCWCLRDEERCRWAQKTREQQEKAPNCVDQPRVDTLLELARDCRRQRQAKHRNSHCCRIREIQYDRALPALRQLAHLARQ